MKDPEVRCWLRGDGTWRVYFPAPGWSDVLVSGKTREEALTRAHELWRYAHSEERHAASAP